MSQVLNEPNIYKKLQFLDHEIHNLLILNQNSTKINFSPKREISIQQSKLNKKRQGLSSIAGQGKLLHDLSNIELQAMELGLRTLHDYPEAPQQFREELAKIVLEEAKHLKSCLDSLKLLGYKWGDWPIHLHLWSCTEANDSLLERIVIVHRYLEGSGIDSGQRILDTLRHISSKKKEFNHTTETVNMIVQDEIEHVKFGSYWFHEIAKKQKVDSDHFFKKTLFELKDKIPRRLEPINHEKRLLAGFTSTEIITLEDLRNEQIKKITISN